MQAYRTLQRHRDVIITFTASPPEAVRSNEGSALTMAQSSVISESADMTPWARSATASSKSSRLTDPAPLMSTSFQNTALRSSRSGPRYGSRPRRRAPARENVCERPDSTADPELRRRRPHPCRSTTLSPWRPNREWWDRWCKTQFGGEVTTKRRDLEPRTSAPTSVATSPIKIQIGPPPPRPPGARCSRDLAGRRQPRRPSARPGRRARETDGRERG